MPQLSEHFHSSEFMCRCGCGSKTVAPELVQMLEAIRAHFGVPVTVTSGRRCARHNARVKGAKHSRHLTGEAADIKVAGVAPHAVYNWAVANFQSGGFGRYATFTHVDCRKGKVRW
ncbi:MAG: DUF882 domain-containing protein [Chloroflexia bacterium]|nr:DUF882 domain-containing protein [Chloroflexia bacterium]